MPKNHIHKINRAMMNRATAFILSLLCFAIAGYATASNAETAIEHKKDALTTVHAPAHPTLTKTLKVGGLFKVKSITKNSNRYAVEFESTAKTGKYDLLLLYADSMHRGITIGQQLRISAEVVRTEAARTLVKQLVIFMPAPEGEIPITINAGNNSSFGEMKAEKYIHLHAPQSDFLIL